MHSLQRSIFFSTAYSLQIQVLFIEHTNMDVIKIIRRLKATIKKVQILAMICRIKNDDHYKFTAIHIDAKK